MATYIRKVVADQAGGASILAIAPAGAGKTFGALQYAATEWVDVITAGCKAGIGHHLFGLLRKKLLSTDRDVSFIANKRLMLQEGENEYRVDDLTLRSRWGVYLLRVLFCTLATLRERCKTPRDWLFVQCCHVRATEAAYANAIAHVIAAGVTYEALNGWSVQAPTAVV